MGVYLENFVLMYLSLYSACRVPRDGVVRETVVRESVVRESMTMECYETLLQTAC